jgi:DNA-directed RNA polymerase specialized sigma24 family protein
MEKSTKPNRHYVNNAEFYKAMTAYKKAVLEAQENGNPPPRIPNYIAECIFKIAERLAYRSNFINYSYRDDMIADGLENAIMGINNFDPERYSNPFAYFTQIIYYAFLRRIHREKKQIYIRHKVLENSIIMDTIVERGDHSDEGGAAFVDLNNDYMNDFVTKYETSMELKKKLIAQKREQKKGIEVFYESDIES